MRASLCLAFGLFAVTLGAQQPEASPPPLDEVVVTGEYPGPGMWRVSRPKDPEAHVLWIVGEPWPLPRGWKWKSKDIEATAATAQEILTDSGVSLTSDEKIGFFRGITYAPAVLKARKNPDKATLQDVLPADLYARWLQQKKLYLGRDNGVETWRPLFAADKLRREAFDDLKLREGGAVWEVVGKLASDRKIKVTSPQLKYTFKRDELRGRIKEFSRQTLADEDCFRLTLDLTEALARRDVEKARAHAWAAGDLPALAALPELPSPFLACVMAVMTAQGANDLVPADVRERVHALWVDAVGTSLAANQTTFAVVPFVKLTRKDGYLDRLRAKGYVIEAPL